MVCKPDSVPIYNRQWLLILNNCYQLFLASYHAKLRTMFVKMTLLLGLAPKGVCNTIFVTKKVVSSYLTISPLPQRGGILSVALSLSLHLPGVTWFFFQWSPDFPLDISSDHHTILIQT